MYYLKCIEIDNIINDALEHLTIGKIYIGYEDKLRNNVWIVKNNSGNEQVYYKGRFKLMPLHDIL